MVLPWQATIQDLEGSFLPGKEKRILATSFGCYIIAQCTKERFILQSLWRPRSPSLLSPEKEEEIAKDPKKYSKKYEAED